MQTRYEASFSLDLAPHLEFTEFNALSETRFIEVFYLSFTRPHPKFSLNFTKFCHFSKYRRLGCYTILVEEHEVG